MKYRVSKIYRRWLLFFLLPLSIFADCKHQRVEIGPEGYYMIREKEGGARQTGGLYGFSLIYERIRHMGIYWGAEGRWAWGDLKGHNTVGATLKSRIRDGDINGSLGFSYKFARWGKCLSITPFVGGGYFSGKNSFVDPSPLELTFCTRFSYYHYGFITTLQWNERSSIGIRYKMKMMVEGKCYVSGDSESDDMTLLVNNENQYELEIPFQTIYPLWGKNAHLAFTPFYRFRHYGSRENYPYDFIDTQFIIYGARGGLEIVF